MERRMKIPRFTLAAVLAASATTAFTSTAAAFCRETTESVPDPSFDPSLSRSCGDTGRSLPLFWPVPCIEYRVVVEPALTATTGLTKATASALVHRAASAWTEAACERKTGGPRSPLVSLVDVDQGRCQAGPRGAAAITRNEIRFRAAPSPADQPGLFALTSTVFDTASGALTDAQIEVFNRSAVEPPADDATYERDLHAVVRHELGHFLGIAHSERVEATMFAYYDGTSAAGLSPDDVHAICNVYPPDAPVLGGCAIAAADGGSTPALVAMAIAALTAAARRRTRRAFAR
jgi:hypothetical protein